MYLIIVRFSVSQHMKCVVLIADTARLSRSGVFGQAICVTGASHVRGEHAGLSELPPSRLTLRPRTEPARRSRESPKGPQLSRKQRR